MSLPSSRRADPVDDRPMGNAILRGLLRRCPNCGKGAMFDGYLKVHDACGSCGEALSGHRADDGPAYLTILVVGHLIAPLMLFVFTEFRPAPIWLALMFTVAALVLSLTLLPRLKGAVVGIQWSRRMHGFGAEPERG